MQYCGPKKSMWIAPPYDTLLEASCKKHDDGYEEGGNETRRLICDLFFYTNMLNDINKMYSRLPLWKYKYILKATIYFFAVRLFGWSCFNYKSNKNMSLEGITATLLYKHGLLALFGAFVHALNAHRTGTSKTFIDFLALIIMSSFTGVIFTLLAIHLFPTSPYLIAAVSGTGGYIGIEGMSVVIGFIKNKLK